MFRAIKEVLAIHWSKKNSFNIRTIIILEYGKKFYVSLCLINYASHHESIRRSEDVSPPFLISVLEF
jgi:hypothetical protein